MTAVFSDELRARVEADFGASSICWAVRSR